MAIKPLAGDSPRQDPSHGDQSNLIDPAGFGLAIDAEAQPGNVLPALARLLRALARRQLGQDVLAEQGKNGKAAPVP